MSKRKKVSRLMAALCFAPVLTGFSAQQAEEREIRGQPSWLIRTDQVEMAVTKLGAHMAPVKFYRADDKFVQPYHISPWQGENLDLAYCPVLVPLRGDFFCLPF